MRGGGRKMLPNQSMEEKGDAEECKRVCDTQGYGVGEGEAGGGFDRLSTVNCELLAFEL